MAASGLVLRHIDDQRPREAELDALYISSPKVVRFASLGFNGLAACFYWTRVVQYFGHRHHLHAMTFNELAPLLEITTALDPHLLPPYQFGASFLAPAPPNGAGQPDRAIRLMEYGIRNNPDNWRLYYNLAFVYYTELQDYKKAADIFEQGSKVPNAHPNLKTLAARMNEHAGDRSTARILWAATLESSSEPSVRENAMNHLRSIQVDEDVTNLHKAVMRFRDRTGRPPVSMLELIKAEHFAGFPQDPDGNPYLLTPAGRILVQKPDDFPFITKGFPASEPEFWIVPQYDFDE
jgi:tetratricopeptide (TPR) repeat protein